MVKKCRSVHNNVLSMWVCRNMLFSFELRKSFNFFWCDSSKPQSFRICVHNIVFPVNHWRIALAYLHTYIHTSKPNSSLTPFPLPPPKKKPPKKYHKKQQQRKPPTKKHKTTHIHVQYTKYKGNPTEPVSIVINILNYWKLRYVNKTNLIDFY